MQKRHSPFRILFSPLAWAPERIRRDPLRTLPDSGVPLENPRRRRHTRAAAEESDLPSGKGALSCLVLFSLRRETELFRALAAVKIHVNFCRDRSLSRKWLDGPELLFRQRTDVSLYDVSLYHKFSQFATSLPGFLYFAGICGIMGQIFFDGGLSCGLWLMNTGFIFP